MTNITAKKATYEEVVSVICDPEIMRRTGGGDKAPKDIASALRAQWPLRIVSGYVGDVCAAIYGILPSGLMHFAVLTPHRKYAPRLLNACRTLLPEAVICEIPVTFKEVIRFAVQNGFARVGEKNGKILLSAEGF
jgi:hypothetical protein